MLNRAYIGRRLPATTPVEITEEAVAAFAAALGETGGHIPPTFLISLTLPASDALIDDPDFGLDFSRVLHREQRFSHHRPLRIGERVSCTVQVEDVKVVAGNELLTLRTEVTAEDSEPVATVSTVLFVAAGGDDEEQSVAARGDDVEQSADVTPGVAAGAARSPEPARGGEAS
ncbi:MaoC dehydratase-like protein [Stackebrandtia albiflava]|uniref:MaoC dehydratase-like protein n=1 Tax=Stackebrandtia albiflava TaxID=406432 RepID=A0A562V1E7_9ACTN|nr:MaoC family dehydratase N-terminal domain-containing protein [Stackebrandtia albiflava]TWJ11729.1 MaoC dehydratase-like protein [Stackebrandtia albiflava]